MHLTWPAGLECHAISFRCLAKRTETLGPMLFFKQTENIYHPAPPVLVRKCEPFCVQGIGGITSCHARRTVAFENVWTFAKRKRYSKYQLKK